MAARKSRTSKKGARELTLQEARHNLELSLQTTRHNTDFIRLQVDYLVDEVQSLEKRNTASNANWMLGSLFLGALVGVGGNLMTAALSSRLSPLSMYDWGLGLTALGVLTALLIGLRASSRLAKADEKRRAEWDKKWAHLRAAEDP